MAALQRSDPREFPRSSSARHAQCDQQAKPRIQQWASPALGVVLCIRGIVIVLAGRVSSEDPASAITLRTQFPVQGRTAREHNRTGSCTLARAGGETAGTHHARRLTARVREALGPETCCSAHKGQPAAQRMCALCPLSSSASRPHMRCASPSHRVPALNAHYDQKPFNGHKGTLRATLPMQARLASRPCLLAWTVLCATRRGWHCVERRCLSAPRRVYARCERMRAQKARTRTGDV